MVAPAATTTAAIAPPIHSRLLESSGSSSALTGGAVVSSGSAVGSVVSGSCVGSPHTGAVSEPVLDSLRSSGAQANGISPETVCPSIDTTCQVSRYSPGAPRAAPAVIDGPSTTTQPSP